VWGSFRGIRLSHVLREKLDLHAAMKRQQGDSTEITKMSQEKFLEKGYMVPWEIKYADIKLNEIIGVNILYMLCFVHGLLILFYIRQGLSDKYTKVLG